MATTPSDLVGLNESVDDELDGYFGSQLRNVGYWPLKTTKPYDACRALVDQLCHLLRGKLTEPINSILGVAVGSAELAAELFRKFPSAAVLRTIEPQELAEQVDGKYDAVMLIEGSTPKDRQQAAWPTSLDNSAAVDVHVFAEGLRSAVGAGDKLTKDNAFVDSSERYVADLRAAGFGDVQVLDATTETWLPFFNHSRNFFLAKLLLNQIDSAKQGSIFSRLPAGELGLKQYILVSASKLGTSDDN